MKPRLIIIALSIFFIAQAKAQGGKEASTPSIQLVNSKTHQMVMLEVNQKMAYRLHSSQEFVRDKIKSITDSTISFYESNRAIVTSASGETKVIVPGMDVKVIMKSGERISKMNVLQVDTEKIDGIQISDGNKKLRKKIAIKEILSIVEWNSTALDAGSEVKGIAVENISFKLKDLAAIKITSSKGSRAAGSVLMVIGGLGTFAGIISAVNPVKGSDASGVGTGMHQAGLIIGAAGVPLLVGGIALRGDRKIVLGGSWSFEVKKVGSKN